MAEYNVTVVCLWLTHLTHSDAMECTLMGSTSFLLGNGIFIATLIFAMIIEMHLQVNK